METFLSGLAILAVGGLVTVAVRYPQGYMRLYGLMGVISAVSSTATLAYEIGLRDGGRIVYPLLEPAKIEQAKKAVVAAYPPMWWLVGNLAIIIFAAFLLFLPTILGPPVDHKK